MSDKKPKYYTICFEILGQAKSMDENERYSCTTWYVSQETFIELFDTLIKKRLENETDMS
jgi:hypothetical protein